MAPPTNDPQKFQNLVLFKLYMKSFSIVFVPFVDFSINISKLFTLSKKAWSNTSGGRVVRCSCCIVVKPPPPPVMVPLQLKTLRNMDL